MSPHYSPPRGILKPPWQNIPRLCYFYEHPLKTGLPLKLYEKWDFMSPLVDTIRKLHESTFGATFGVFPGKLSQDMSHPTKRSRGMRHTNRAWSCSRCGNVDQTTLMKELDVVSCPCGLVHGAGELISSDAGVDCTQGARGSNLGLFAGDRFDGNVSHAEHTESTLLQHSHTQVACNVRGLGCIGPIQRMLVKESIARDSSMTTTNMALKPKEQLKGIRILQHIDKLLWVLEPVDHAIKRAVRMSADRSWTLGVKHHKCCGQHAACPLRLDDRPANLLAASVLKLQLQRIIDGDVYLGDTLKVHAQDIQDRLHRSNVMNGSASWTTQITTTASIQKALLESNFDYSCSCPPNTHENSITQGPREGGPHTVDALRRATARVFSANRDFMLPLAVKEATSAILNCSSFISTCCRCNVLRGLSSNALALCVLTATSINKECGDDIARTIQNNAAANRQLCIGTSVMKRGVKAAHTAILQYQCGGAFQNGPTHSKLDDAFT